MRADGSGHAVAFVVMRQSEEIFSVSIVNPCGEGEEYHAKEADPVRGKVWLMAAIMPVVLCCGMSLLVERIYING